jgi:hypothetical protein
MPWNLEPGGERPPASRLPKHLQEEYIMKTLVTFATAALLAGSALAQGNNISAPIVPRRALPPVNPAPAEGGLQRGARLGHPLEMFSPFAPVEYGDGQDYVTPRDENTGINPGRGTNRPAPVGLRLFTITF